MNHFAYAAGNPETASDPSGQWPWDNVVKAVTHVVKAAASAVVHVVQVAAPIVASVADSALGISSMIGDVKTLFDPHKSWTDKLFSVVDLAVNVAMDVDTITGTGEAARAAYMGLKVGVKFAGKEAEHMGRKETGPRESGPPDHIDDSAGSTKSVKVTLHLTVETAQRLGVESAMRRISQSAIAEEVLAAYLSRWQLPAVTDAHRLEAG